MLFTGDLYSLLNFLSFARWLFIGLAVAGMIYLRYKRPDMPRPFKVTMVTWLFSINRFCSNQALYLKRDHLMKISSFLVAHTFIWIYLFSENISWDLAYKEPQTRWYYVTSPTTGYFLIFNSVQHNYGSNPVWKPNRFGGKCSHILQHQTEELMRNC